MRVAHIITGLALGGAEMMLYRLLGSLRGEPLVISLTPGGALAPRIIGLGVPLIPLGLARGRPDPQAVLALAGHLRRFEPDLVQTWMYHADLLGGLSARLATRAPVVWGLHNSNLDPATTPWTTRATVTTCARLSRLVPRRILSCSEVSRRVHVALGYDAARMLVIPNGFDLAAFAPDPVARATVRAELGLPADARLVGLFARWHPQKDQGTFIRAAAGLADGFRDCHFLLAGGDIDGSNAALAALLAASGRRERFHLLGVRDDMPRLTAALDVAVTAAAFGEAFPLVVGEAMASGVPCVVTDVGDSALMVGDTGRVVPPRDPAALGAAIGGLLALPTAAREALGAAARARIAAEYGLPAIAGRYGALYQSLVAGDR